VCFVSLLLFSFTYFYALIWSSLTFLERHKRLQISINHKKSIWYKISDIQIFSSQRTCDADHNFSGKWFAIFFKRKSQSILFKSLSTTSLSHQVSAVKDPSSSPRNPVKFMPGFSCSPLSPACSSTGRLQASVSRGSSAHVRLATLHGCPVFMQGIHRSEKRGQADAITFVLLCGSSFWGLETGTSHSSVGVNTLYACMSECTCVLLLWHYACMLCYGPDHMLLRATAQYSASWMQTGICHAEMGLPTAVIFCLSRDESFHSGLLQHVGL